MNFYKYSRGGREYIETQPNGIDEGDFGHGFTITDGIRELVKLDSEDPELVSKMAKHFHPVVTDAKDSEDLAKKLLFFIKTKL